MQREPGSSMHIHQSVRDLATGRNLFAAEDGGNSEFFLHYIGGLQKYLSASMPLLAPYVNSYRRLMPDSDAPINVHWGVDNRSEEHTSELQSLMRNSYAVFCLTKNTQD